MKASNKTIESLDTIDEKDCISAVMNIMERMGELHKNLHVALHREVVAQSYVSLDVDPKFDDGLYHSNLTDLYATFQIKFLLKSGILASVRSVRAPEGPKTIILHDLPL